MAITLKDRIDAQVIFNGSDDTEEQVHFALHLIGEGITSEDVDDLLGDRERPHLYLSLILSVYGEEVPTNINDKVKRHILDLMEEADLSQLQGFCYPCVWTAFHMFGKLSLRRLAKTLDSKYHNLAQRAAETFPEDKSKYEALYKDFSQLAGKRESQSNRQGNDRG